MRNQEDDIKQELIVELFQRFEEACYLYNKIECWSARELQEILALQRRFTLLRHFENYYDVLRRGRLVDGA